MRKKTTRNLIEELMRARAVFLSEIAKHVSEKGNEWRPEDVIPQIEHINKSLDNEQVLVRPPYCKDCGFNRYDNHLNIPSKCPECYSHWIEEPQVKIG